MSNLGRCRTPLYVPCLEKGTAQGCSPHCCRSASLARPSLLEVLSGSPATASEQVSIALIDLKSSAHTFHRHINCRIVQQRASDIVLVAE